MLLPLHIHAGVDPGFREICYIAWPNDTVRRRVLDRNVPLLCKMQKKVEIWCGSYILGIFIRLKFKVNLKNCNSNEDIIYYSVNEKSIRLGCQW